MADRVLLMVAATAVENFQFQNDRREEERKEMKKRNLIENCQKWTFFVRRSFVPDF